jgi:hypothetical protein
MVDPTFKERHRDLQELVRELAVVRRHNLQFKAGDAQTTLLMFAEFALVLITLERFVRVVVGVDPNDESSLFNLLEQATSRKLLELPFDDQHDGIRKICKVRNTILHGNFEQAALGAGVADVRTYFQTVFAGELEAMMKIADYLMQQIDPATGQPRSKGIALDTQALDETAALLDRPLPTGGKNG